jgi:riboflavin biosynthesis pyrimidine reductase
VEHLEVQPGQEFETLQDHFGDWNGWLCSYAIDAHGNSVGEAGKSSDLSSSFDLELLKSLRSQADCIVTTGKTARIENYRASKFAPIAFLTRNPMSLMEIPAFSKPGEFENIVFSEFEDSTLFLEVRAALERRGFKKLLFEGGASSLNALVSQSMDVSLVASISNSSEPSSLDPLHALRGLVGDKFQATIIKDLATDTNRVIRWTISGSPTTQ